MRNRSDARKKTKKSKPVEEADSFFQTAPDQAHLPDMPDLKKGFQEVVSKIFESDIDLLEEFDTIEGSLSITGKLTPGVIQRAANQTASMSLRAYRLYIVGKIEYESYMRQTEIILSGIRDGATKKLETEKASGIRTKQITDADVTSYMAAEYPDEWDKCMLRRTQAKGMLGYLEQLSSLASKQCYTVARMLTPTGEL